MLHWIADRALLIYVILGLFALGFALLYRNYGDRRSVFAMFGTVLVGLLVWVLTLFVVSDRQQIERNLHAMAKAVLDNNPAELRKYLSPDFNFRGLDADKTARAAPPTARWAGIRDIQLKHIRIENVSRSEGKADVYFTASIDSSEFEVNVPAQVQALFVWRDGSWLMQKLEVYPPVGSQPLQFPIHEK